MKMVNLNRTLLILFSCLLSLLIFASQAHARTYIGGGTGKAEFDTRGSDEGESEKYYIGFQPSGKLYSVEIGFLDSGETDISGSSFESITVEAYNLSIAYHSTPAFGFRQPVNWFIKAGYYFAETEVKTATSSFSEDSDGFSFGIGVDYAINDALSLRADFEGLYKIEDFDDDGLATFVTIGAQINF